MGKQLCEFCGKSGEFIIDNDGDSYCSSCEMYQNKKADIKEVKKWADQTPTEKKVTIDLIAQELLPEVKIITASALKEVAHKNGYDKVLNFCSKVTEQFPAGAPFPIKAGLMRSFYLAGYPADTLGEVAQILGWSI